MIQAEKGQLLGKTMLISFLVVFIFYAVFITRLSVKMPTEFVEVDINAVMSNIGHDAISFTGFLLSFALSLLTVIVIAVYKKISVVISFIVATVAVAVTGYAGSLFFPLVMKNFAIVAILALMISLGLIYSLAFLFGDLAGQKKPFFLLIYGAEYSLIVTVLVVITLVTI